MMGMPSNKYAKPFIKWAGGKRQLLPEIKERIPAVIKGTYFEPFVGAGAVFLELQRNKATINDLNSELIDAYTSIKENVDELIELLQAYAIKNEASFFYEIRSKDRDETFNDWSKVEKAARFIYLNKTCYNGLYRVSAQGFFNTPFGNYKKPAICEEIKLRAISNYLNTNSVTIYNGDYEKSVKAKKDDFVYFDPPYHSPDKTNFTGYQKGGFDESEQERLFRLFAKLSDDGVKCMLSNSATPFIKNLYKDYNIDVVKATRAINSISSERGAVDEVIVRSWWVDE